MAKKIGVSTPMTIDVLLPPFTESFFVDKSDTTMQWRYDVDGSFKPDRAVTPLLLTPTLTVFDQETKRTYIPAFSKVRWYLLDTTKGTYSIEITNTTDGDVDYVVLANGNLKVKKNVMETAPVDIMCELRYIDPRNTGKTYTVRDYVQLTTNMGSGEPAVRIHIAQESTVKYNPFVDGYTVNADGVKTKTFTFNASAKKGDTTLDLTSPDSSYRIRWYAMGDGITAETLIDATEAGTGAATINLPKFPAYVSGQNTPTLVLNAMMCESMTIIARVVNTSTNTMYPEKKVVTLRWGTFKTDAKTEAVAGGAIKQDTASKTFRNIVTIRNKTLTEAQVNENFIQEFKYRRASKTSSAGSTPTDTVESLGCGPTVEVPSSKLRSSDSSLVYSELSMLGNYGYVAQDGKVIVHNGKVIVSRM